MVTVTTIIESDSDSQKVAVTVTTTFSKWNLQFFKQF